MDKKTKKVLVDAIKLRARAKALEEEAKGMILEAKSAILPILAAYEIKLYPVAGIGTVTVKISKGSNINAAKLREELILWGMKVEDIEATIGNSTKSWETEYVEFKREK